MVELLVENVRVLKESRERSRLETSTDNNRNLRGNSHGQTTDRYFRAAAERRARRSAAARKYRSVVWPWLFPRRFLLLSVDVSSLKRSRARLFQDPDIFDE